jgi:hypothetical protein
MLLPVMEINSILPLIFKSLPLSLSNVMTVWEPKKEKKKSAMDMNAMLLGVVCHDENDSADH